MQAEIASLALAFKRRNAVCGGDGGPVAKESSLGFNSSPFLMRNEGGNAGSSNERIIIPLVGHSPASLTAKPRWIGGSVGPGAIG
jgi:hypothetical protein